MAEYIEREALVEQIKSAQVSLESDDDKTWERNKPYFKGLAWAHRLVLDTPAADVAEVRRGNWGKQQFSAKCAFLSYNDFICNKCGGKFEVGIGRDFMYYCPNCGAKMDGEDKP